MRDKTQRDITAVCCVGNYYLSDDGFAIHLFRKLENTRLPNNVELRELGLIGFSQFDSLLSCRKLIVADALKGVGRPGQIFRFDLLNDPPVFSKTMLSAHDFGIMELLDAVRVLCPENLPEEAVLFGAEAKITDQYGTALSPQLNTAIFRVRAMILEEIGVPF